MSPINTIGSSKAGTTSDAVNEVHSAPHAPSTDSPVTRSERSRGIGYIERLDHLRFLAASLVLLFHTQIMCISLTPSNRFQIPLIDQGHVGVQLFMVISGMILSMIAYNKQIQSIRFYWNRVLRIYPLFIFVLSLGYFSTPDPRPPATSINFLLALLPISNISRAQYGEFGGQLWSIAVELQFYLLFPILQSLLVRLKASYHLSLIAFLIMLRAGVYLLHGAVHHLSFFSIFGALDLFLIGQLLGTLYSAGRVKLQNPIWLLCSFVALNLVVYAAFRSGHFFHVPPVGYIGPAQNQHWLWVIWPDILGIIFAILIPAYLQSKITIPFSRAFATLGRFSYSIYLWHIMVILGVQKLALQGLSPYALGFLVVLPLTVAVSAASYYLIERPFLSLRVSYTS